MRRFDLISFIIVFFFIVGFITVLLTSPTSIIIPLIVFGLIFYFIKNPEKLSRITRKKSYRVKNYTRQNKKKAKFTIIQGQKKDNDDFLH